VRLILGGSFVELDAHAASTIRFRIDPFLNEDLALTCGSASSFTNANTRALRSASNESLVLTVLLPPKRIPPRDCIAIPALHGQLARLFCRRAPGPSFEKWATPLSSWRLRFRAHAAQRFYHASQRAFRQLFRTDSWPSHRGSERESGLAEFLFG